MASTNKEVELKQETLSPEFKGEAVEVLDAQEEGDGQEFAPPVTPEDLRSAEFGNSVENVLFSRFLYEIGSSDASVRSRAAKGIGGIKHALSVKALAAQYMREPVAQTRKECIKALGQLEMEEGLDTVREALGDTAPSVRLAALRAVYRLVGINGAAEIISLLEDENFLVRCRAATCLGWIGNPELALELLPLLEDENASVRRAGVDALGNLRNTETVPVLFERLADDDESVRDKALEALGGVIGANLADKLPEDEEERSRLIEDWKNKWDEGEFSVIEPETAAPAEGSAPESEENMQDNNGGRASSRNAQPEITEERSAPKRTAPPSLEEFHVLERERRELLVRVKELEYEAAAKDSMLSDIDSLESGEYEAVSEESVDIIAIVRDLERELDAAFDLKESLESDLSATREALDEEVGTRRELEAQVDLLEAQADLASQLREEISFIKEERDTVSRKLSETNERMDKTQAEFDSLSEQVNSAESSVKALQRDKVDLEAQVITLKDKVRELADLTEAKRSLEARVRDITSRLKTTEISKNSLELELTKVVEIGRGLREENEDLRKNLNAANLELTNLRARLQEQEDENRELISTNGRIDSEFSSLQAKYDAATKVLDAAKKSLRDIRSAALRTTEHFRDRYHRPGERRGK